MSNRCAANLMSDQDIEHQTAAKPEPPVRRMGSAVLLAAACLVGFIVWVFGGVVFQDFVDWDDQIHVFENPYLKTLTTANVGHFWTHAYENLYIPISYTLYSLLANVARLRQPDSKLTDTGALFNPHIFHTANLVLHTANALIVLVILRRLTQGCQVAAPKSGLGSLGCVIGALFFAVHPLQVESVAWISELRGLLSAFFSLGAVYAYVAAVGGPNVAQSRSTPVRRSAPDWRQDAPAPTTLFRRKPHTMYLLLLALALLSKPGAVTLPVALIALDRWILGRSWRSCLLCAVPGVVLALPFVVITHFVQPVPAHIVAPLWQRPLIAADALAFYDAKLFFPLNLTIDYGRKPAIIFLHGWAYWTWIAPVAIGTLVFVWARRSREGPESGAPGRYPHSNPGALPDTRSFDRAFIAGTLFAVAMLLPVLGLAPFAFQDFSTVADRYMYLAMLGPSLIVAQGINAAIAGSAGIWRPWAVGLGALVVVGLLGFVSRGDVRHWDNSLTLFRYAVQKNPQGYQIRNNYAVALFEAGQLDEAAAQCRIAIALHPIDPDAYTDLGRALRDKGDLAGAGMALQTAVAQAPGDATARQNLGIVYFRLGRYADAAAQFAQAVALKPQSALIHSDYAGSLASLGRTDEAVRQFRTAIALDPTLARARSGLAEALLQTGSPEAEAAFRDALRADPNNATEHINFGGLLAQQGRFDEALAEYQKAEALLPENDEVHYDTGYALLHTGQADAAVGELSEAVRLRPSSADNHDELGVALAVARQIPAARAEFQTALRLNPGLDSARKHLAMVSSQ